MADESESALGPRGTRFLISGRVQRVGFRAATRRQALALGLEGHARNLPDGRVEVVASGSPEAVAALREWLAAGPRFARVDAVEEAGESPLSGAGFRSRLKPAAASGGPQGSGQDDFTTWNADPSRLAALLVG